MLNIQSNEVKTHFSGVLRQVEQGQEFLITKHKKVVAKLTPYSTDLGNKTQSQKAVKAMKALNNLNLSQSDINDYRHSGQR